MLKFWHAADLCPLQGGTEEVADEHVTLCSSSDHSDIVTLGDSSKEERAAAEGDGDDDDGDDEEVAAGSEDLYMGTSSSSQYTFSAPETGELLHVLVTSLADCMHNSVKRNKDRTMN